MSAGTVISSIFAIILSLAFVLALAFGAIWLLRKFQDGSFGKIRPGDGGRTLRFERALPIGPRERLVIVELDGEHLLLGVTASTITQLRSWPKDEATSFDQTDDAPAAPPESRQRFRLPMARSEPS